MQINIAPMQGSIPYNTTPSAKDSLAFGCIWQIHTMAGTTGIAPPGTPCPRSCKQSQVPRPSARSATACGRAICSGGKQNEQKHPLQKNNLDGFWMVSGPFV